MKVWSKRKALESRKTNVRKSLVNPNKVYLPPLHLKLDIIQTFAKALDENGKTFLFYEKTFAKLSGNNINKGFVTGDFH